MTQVIWAPQAIEDVEAIRAYVARDSAHYANLLVDIIKAKEDDRVMFIRFDDALIDGVLSIDGYVDARIFGTDDVAKFIVQRLGQLPERGSAV